VGVSSAQLFVLQSLAGGPGVSLGELATLTHTDQSSVSVVVSRLVRRGLVKRAVSANDARRLELSLTTRGLALLDTAPSPLQANLLGAIQHLPEAERRHLADLIERVVDDAGIGQEPPEMMLEGEEQRRKSGAVKRSPKRPSLRDPR
jgi:DNA-binding MarR family transcriptional regulator